MSELPRIAPTTPGDAIRPLKPTKGPERDPKRRRRERRKDRDRDEAPASKSPSDPDESEKGGGIDVRV